MDTTENIAPRPPSQDQVLARSVCLGALLYRGFIEQVIQFLDEPALKHFQVQLVAKLNGWLKAQGFATHLTRAEGECLSRAFGSWPLEMIERRGDWCEGLGVLLWALGARETLPRYDAPFELPDLGPLLGLRTDHLATADDERARQFPRLDPAWLQTIRLRDAESLAQARRGADAWLWRAQLAASQAAELPLPEGTTYEAMIREGTKAAWEAGVLGEMLEDDFVLLGKSYAELDAGELQQAAAIAESRQCALNWLCGYATLWDDVLK